ncbi:hypothetical protein [Halalkalibacter krulwichiae]|uniref:hypothetical protein n=1 Tax=Halalkalibacter krulwichiae TaxID=199441 RepID=UPI001471FAA1|nr:hypothetical protein [Halalkalibacter krulwichiae]
MFQLLCGVTIRVALCFFLLPNLFNAQSTKIRVSLVVSTAVFFLIGMVLHISDIWMQTILKMYFYISVLIFGVSMTLLLLIISYLPKKKGSNAYEKQST